MIEVSGDIILKFLAIQYVVGRLIHEPNEFIYIEWIIGEFRMCSTIWMMTLWMN